MDRERTKGEIIKLVRDSVKPRQAPGPAPAAGPQITGDRNVIAMRDVNIVVKAPRAKDRAKRREWRDEIAAALRARAGELRLTEEQLLEIARDKLKRPVASIAALGARDLGRVYDAMLSLKRPALE
ncbi:MAG: hypothetical protein ACREQI_07845 [Candidatus Binataceae bacterium]